ncbi:hypothetical protein C6499_01840 [Candidatus Poribacteria bacterium]|nr:MAG: hypothetical protein C6499_01840 [Candidatus Poribacteria bacterium]
MFLRSRLFWGGVLFCVCMAVFLGLLLYRANQPQEPIIIYKTVVPERRATSSGKLSVQTTDAIDETEVISPSADSDMSIDPVDFTLTDTQFLDKDVQSEESVVFDAIEGPSGSVPEEERFFGLTLAEIEERIPVLEEEIRTNLTKAVELYTELMDAGAEHQSVHGRKPYPPEFAKWHVETWQEVKRLFHEVADGNKILPYVSYLRVTGRENPLRPGGWLYELLEPLPMNVSVTFN